MSTRQHRAAAILLAALLLASAAPAQATGSWSHISQELTRPESWQPIVERSDFALGELSPLEPAAEDPYYEMGFGGYPSLDGSTVAVPMALEFARQHLPVPEEDLPAFVQFSTTHAAYERLILRKPNLSAQLPSLRAFMDETHPVDLLLATPPSDAELALAAEQGVELVMEPVCYDAFIFLTHRSNPLDSLTVEQIRAIYRGEITSWAEVGGDELSIRAYQRQPNSGSQTAMEDLVMQGEPMAGAVKIQVVPTMDGTLRQIGTFAGDSHSLGYSYLYYLESLYQQADVKVLAIDGISPTPDNLRSGAYPFTARYYGVLRKEDEGGTAGQFLAWMRSEEGQRCIAQAGYIPLEPLQ